MELEFGQGGRLGARTDGLAVTCQLPRRQGDSVFPLDHFACLPGAACRQACPRLPWTSLGHYGRGAQGFLSEVGPARPLTTSRDLEASWLEAVAAGCAPRCSRTSMHGVCVVCAIAVDVRARWDGRVRCTVEVQIRHLPSSHSNSPPGYSGAPPHAPCFYHQPDPHCLGLNDLDDVNMSMGMAKGDSRGEGRAVCCLIWWNVCKSGANAASVV